MSEPRPMRRRKGGWERSLQYSTAGIELSLSVVVGYFFGHWLDGTLGTDPYLMISFVIIGTASGMRGLYRTTKRVLVDQGDPPESPPDSPEGRPGGDAGGSGRREG